MITSEDRCKVLLIISCLQYWHSLKRYIFFEYFDGIVGNLILQLNGLNMYVGDGKVVVGQQFVVSWHFGEGQTDGWLCLVFRNDGVVSRCWRNIGVGWSDDNSNSTNFLNEERKMFPVLTLYFFHVNRWNESITKTVEFGTWSRGGVRTLISEL